MLLSRFSRVWLFATPWTVAHQAPLSMEFSRQEHWSGLPSPSPGDLPNPGIEPRSPSAPALQADSLPLSHWVAAAKSLQSCLTLCNSIDGSPPGSPIPGILQARTLEWVAISFSDHWVSPLNKSGYIYWGIAMGQVPCQLRVMRYISQSSIFLMEILLW